LTNWCISWLTWPPWSTYLSDASALVVNWPLMMHQSNSYRWPWCDGCKKQFRDHQYLSRHEGHCAALQELSCKAWLQMNQNVLPPEDAGGLASTSKRHRFSISSISHSVRGFANTFSTHKKRRTDPNHDGANLDVDPGSLVHHLSLGIIKKLLIVLIGSY